MFKKTFFACVGLCRSAAVVRGYPYNDKKIAKSFNLDVTGSLGIIVKAKEKNMIANVKDVLTKNKIKATDFYLPTSLKNLILKVVGEQK